MRGEKILAIVGMAGSGKSEVAKFFKEKGFSLIRFGDETDTRVRELGLPLSEENERYYREKIRRELGMAAYATVAKPRIDQALKESSTVILDGLYSWEEYKYLVEQFPYLLLICVFAEPEVRYRRLEKRTVRPLDKEEARERDFSEIENTNKGGPIALADYFIENNGTLEQLQVQVDKLVDRIT